MARLPDLIPFAQEHGLKIGAIADLIHYRNQTESLVERAADRLIQTVYGAFRLVAYRDKCAKETHLALVKGEIHADRETLVRVHEPLSVMDFLDGIGAQILRDRGVGKMMLLASPRKMPAMDGFGLEVTGYSEKA